MTLLLYIAALLNRAPIAKGVMVNAAVEVLIIALNRNNSPEVYRTRNNGIVDMLVSSSGPII